MKIKKLLEELMSGEEEELKGKEDLPRFVASLKSKLLRHSFSKEQTDTIVNTFIKDLNSSGWMAKIIVNNPATKDVILNLEGSTVNFIVVSDANPRDRKTFTYQGVAQNNDKTPPVTSDKITRNNNRTMLPNERMANIEKKVER